MATDKATNNRLIAEFMGLVPLNHLYTGAYTTNENTESNFRFFVNSNMEDENWYVYPKFHESWDWLMKVVEKVDLESGHFVQIDGMSCTVKSLNLEYVSTSQGKNRLDATYMAVVSFIEWYNKQNNKP